MSRCPLTAAPCSSRTPAVSTRIHSCLQPVRRCPEASPERLPLRCSAVTITALPRIHVTLQVSNARLAAKLPGPIAVTRAGSPQRSSAVPGCGTARLRARFRHPALPAAPHRYLCPPCLSLDAPSPKRAEIPKLSPALAQQSPPLESGLPPGPHYHRRAGPRTGPGESAPRPCGRRPPSPAGEALRPPSPAMARRATALLSARPNNAPRCQHGVLKSRPSFYLASPALQRAPSRRSSRQN